MLSTRYKAAKFAIYVLVLLALTVMQNTPGLFAIMNIKPMLAAAMAISVAMFEGELAGGFMGAFAGFCCDLFSSYSFGYYTLTLFFFCVTIGLLVQSYMRPVVANAILFTFITMAVIQWIGFFSAFCCGDTREQVVIICTGCCPCASIPRCRRHPFIILPA